MLYCSSLIYLMGILNENFKDFPKSVCLCGRSLCIGKIFGTDIPEIIRLYSSHNMATTCSFNMLFLESLIKKGIWKRDSGNLKSKPPSRS